MFLAFDMSFIMPSSIVQPHGGEAGGRLGSCRSFSSRYLDQLLIISL
jgi:hypothetical protein